MKDLIVKIAKAKLYLKTTKMKKSGRNTFSKYDYFTPEDVDRMVSEVCEKFNLLTTYSLTRDEHGRPEGLLTIFDLDSGASLEYVQITETPEIKATNIAQQMGGMVTYNERYICMSAFGIKDNSLDFDASHNTPKEPRASVTQSIKPALPTLPKSGALFTKAVHFIKGDGTVDGLRTHYVIGADVEKLLLDASK